MHRRFTRDLTVCLPILLAGLAFAVLAAPTARAQQLDCLPTQQPLVKIPEIDARNGTLRGTVLLGDEEQRMTFRVPPQSIPGSLTQRTATACLSQYVRAFQVGGAPLPYRRPAEPLPGPTLRARVGDMVELTFLNHIDPNNFGNSIDQDIKGGGTGCDEAGGGLYPGSFDKFPDCF